MIRRTIAGGLATLTLLTACTSSAENGRGSIARTPSVGASSSSRAGAAPSAAPSAPAGSAVPAAHFRDCRQYLRLSALRFPAGRLARLQFECATISVPLDYAAPGGRAITLQLIRVHDRANSARAHQLLVNPGGPGVSGVELAVGLSTQVSDPILRTFDLVGFDPRGVGSSSPLRCLSDKQKDSINAASPNVLSVAGFEQAKRLAGSIARACTSKYGRALAEFNTEQTARDMDRIRAAVGDSRMNYLGFSYGTQLGATYAQLFPTRIRVAVLDGAVDPLTDDITSFTNQLQGFEQSFDQFGAWCRTHQPCSGLGNARTAVYRLARTATRTPLPSSVRGETRRATSSLFYTGVLYALYSSAKWPTLATALLAARRGDAAQILALADGYNERFNGKYTNVSDANTAISCNDTPRGLTDARIRETAQDWASRFPIFGLWSAPALFSCQQWQPDRTRPPRPTARTSATVLVVGNLHDPATPYQGAKDLTKTMGHAELLTWDGAGHTSYLQGSSCVDRYVDAYLVRVSLPPRATTCR